MREFTKAERFSAVLFMSLLVAVPSCTKDLSSSVDVVDFYDPNRGPCQLQVSIVLGQATLEPTQTTQASFVATRPDGKQFNKNPSWSSLDTKVATVTSTGLVTAVSIGTVAIRAALGSCLATTPIAVKSPDVQLPRPAMVAVAIDSPSITVGHVAIASAVVEDSAGNPLSGQDVAWSSLATNVATVSSAGAVTAVAAGTAIVKASVGTLEGTSSIVVNASTPTPPPPPVVASVVVAIDSSSLTVGNVSQARATALDASGNAITGLLISWTSLSPSIASISSAGSVKALAAGTANIQATVAGVNASSAVTVVAAPPPPPVVASVVVTIDSTSLTVGNVSQARATAKDAYGAVITGLAVSWTSLSPSIASISSTGSVKALAAGTANIQATIAGVNGSHSVTVVAAPPPPPVVASVVVTIDSSSLAVGNVSQARATAKDASGVVITGLAVSWTSLSPSIASVSSAGSVKGLAVGSASVQATIAGISGNRSVTIVAAPTSQITSVTVKTDSLTFQVGHVAQASAIAKDAAGNVVSGSFVTWSSLSPGVATVSNGGTVTALSAGSASIQATISGVTGSLPVTVINHPDLASTNFDDGTLGSAYTYGYTSADLSFLSDPTNSGRGKVARFHYAKIGVDDINRSMEYRHSNGSGQTLYFRGEFYIPAGSPMTDGTYQRKLLYWLPHTDYTKYGSNGSGAPVFWSLVTMFGDGLFWNGVMVAQNSANNIDIMARLATITPGQWYTIEKQITPESSIGAKDGVVRIWLNGNLVFTKTNMQWTDPAWIGQPLPNGNGTPLQASDVYFQRYEVGDQVNYSGTFDEYRYWDQVAFSSTRIGN